MKLALTRTALPFALIVVMASCRTAGPQPPRDDDAREHSQTVRSAVDTGDAARWAAVTEAPGRASSKDWPAAEASVPLTPATAQQGSNLDRDRTGRWELVLSGVGNNDEDFEVGGGQVNVGVGYYITDALQIGLRQNLSLFDPGPGSDFWDGATRVAVDFHFGHATVVPFVGVNLGWVYGDTVDETMAGGGQVGLKFYPADNAFLHVTAEYLALFDENDAIGEALEDGQFLYSLGIGLRF